MEDFKFFDPIRRYALGKMSPSEQAEFKQQLAHDPDLAEVWHDYQFIADAVSSSKQNADDEAPLQAAQDALRQEGFFENVHEQIRRQMAQEAEQVTVPGQHPRRKGQIVAMFRQYGWVAAAASIAILLAACLFWPHQATSTFDLQASLHIQSSNLGFSDQDTSALMLQMLIEGRPDDVIQLYQHTANQSNSEIRLCYGVAWLQKKNYGMALPIFEGVMNNQNAQFQTEYKARYYAAQCYKALGNNARSVAELKRVAYDTARESGRKSDFAQLATDLLGTK